MQIHGHMVQISDLLTFYNTSAGLAEKLSAKPGMMCSVFTRTP
jgi:hypothetical protein